jgi:hypothetical protein
VCTYPEPTLFAVILPFKFEYIVSSVRSNTVKDKPSSRNWLSCFPLLRRIHPREQSFSVDSPASVGVGQQDLNLFGCLIAMSYLLLEVVSNDMCQVSVGGRLVINKGLSEIGAYFVFRDLRHVVKQSVMS